MSVKVSRQLSMDSLLREGVGHAEEWHRSKILGLVAYDD